MKPTNGFSIRLLPLKQNTETRIGDCRPFSMTEAERILEQIIADWAAIPKKN